MVTIWWVSGNISAAKIPVSEYYHTIFDSARATESQATISYCMNLQDRKYKFL